MNFKLFALVAASFVCGQASTLKSCQGDKWVNKLTKAIYINGVEAFVTATHSLVQRSELPAKHRVIGPKYAGDMAYLSERLTIFVNDNDKVVNVVCQ